MSEKTAMEPPEPERWKAQRGRLVKALDEDLYKAWAMPVEGDPTDLMELLALGVQELRNIRVELKRARQTSSIDERTTDF